MGNFSEHSWGFSTSAIIVATDDYVITGTDITVYAAGLQLPDGTVDNGTGPAAEAPKVWVGNDDGLTSEQARVFAHSLLALADVIDTWSGVRP